VADDLVAQDEVALHPFPAQIQVPVTEPQGLIHWAVFIDIKRGRLGSVKNSQVVNFNLDVAGGQVGVLLPFGPGSNFTPNLDHILIS
jgi:hypothetical protein